jgi:hypothetical protein
VPIRNISKLRSRDWAVPEGVASQIPRELARLLSHLQNFFPADHFLMHVLDMLLYVLHELVLLRTNYGESILAFYFPLLHGSCHLLLRRRLGDVVEKSCPPIT